MYMVEMQDHCASESLTLGYFKSLKGAEAAFDAEMQSLEEEGMPLRLVETESLQISVGAEVYELQKAAQDVGNRTLLILKIRAQP